MKEKIQQLKKDHILAIATKYFTVEGYSETKMSIVAKEAGVSIGTIYDFFENKDGVFEACLINEIQKHVEILQELLTKIDDPKEKLIKTVEFKFASISKHQNTFEDLMKATPWFFSKIAIADTYEDFTKILAEVFREIHNKTPFKRDNMTLLARNFQFFADSFLIDKLKNNQPLTVAPEELVEEFLYGVVK